VLDKIRDIFKIQILLYTLMLFIITLQLPFGNSSHSFAITPCSESNLVDNFNSTYYLGKGQTSPNGKWENVYPGSGSTGVEIANGNHSFFLKPKTATNPEDTNAALVKSTDSFCNFVIDVDVKTVKQLRENSPPNTWEAGWIFFRYTDTFHYYWFTISADVIELGKKDCNTCTNPVDGQQFLVTKHNPILPLNSWSHWTIDVNGNHIKMFVDGKLVIDYKDKKMTPKLSSGNIAMYSEDAYVLYDNLKVESQ
jgi:hypothetical protein